MQDTDENEETPLTETSLTDTSLADTSLIDTGDTGEQGHSRTPYVQASFRLTPETYDSIRQMAVSKGISQSEVMRKAAQLLGLTDGLPEHIKLATVDINNHAGPDHYKVESWLLVD